MKAIVLSLMLCVGICSSSPATRLHKRQACDLSGFSDYRIRFPNTGFRACVWDFFACKRTEKSSDYNELDREESSDYSGLDVRGDSLAASCCRQRFDACYNVIKKPKKTTAKNKPSKKPSVSEKKCLVGGVEYFHKEEIATQDPCQTCQCFDGEVTCSVKECPPPPVWDRSALRDCMKVAPRKGECCPTYECTESGNDVEDSEDYSQYDTRGDELDSRSDSLFSR